MHRTLYFKKKIGIIVREETITVSSPVFFMDIAVKNGGRKSYGTKFL